MKQFSVILIILLFISQILLAQDKEPKEQSLGFTPIVQVFGNTSYSVGPNYYNFVLGRTHLGGKYVFNDSWSAKIIIDRGRPTTMSDFTIVDSIGNIWNVSPNVKEGAYYTMWLKFASLKWQISKNLSVETGAILQNHYITQERFWGHRFVAQTFQDRYWGIPSSDLGFIAKYKVNDFLSFDAAFTNGEGLRVQQDNAGRIKLAFGLDITPCGKLQFRMYSHFRQSPFNNSDEYLFSAFGGYKVQDWLRIGGEVNYLENQNFIEGFSSYGGSAFAVCSFHEKFDAYFRFDHIENDYAIQQSLAFQHGNAIIYGLTCEPVQNVRVSLNHQYWQSYLASGKQNLVGFSFEFKF